MDGGFKSDVNYQDLPSQLAVKSVQGANQAREDLRLELARGRRASMTRRVSAAAAMANANKVAPDTSTRQEPLDYPRRPRRRMSSITTDEALMLIADKAAKKSSSIDLEALGFETCHTEEEQLKQLARLRDMPCPIGVKRLLRCELLRAKLMNQEVKMMKGWKGWKYKQERDRRRCRLFCKGLSYKFELWQGSFKEIEGHFGTGVLSYFVFLKWLLQLNLIIFLLLLCFIILPQAVLNRTVSDRYDQACVNSNTSNIYQDVEYVGHIVPNCTADYQSYLSNLIGGGNYSVVSYITDFIQGTGWMEDTYLFYGFYSSSVLKVDVALVSDYVKTYDLPFAYIVVTGIHFLLSLVLMVKQSAKGFRESVTSTDSKYYQFCNKAFGGWDFALSDPKNVVLKKKSLLQEIKHDLNEQRDTERRDSRTTFAKLKLWTLRLLINIFVLAALGGSGYAIFYATDRSTVITASAEYKTWNSSLQLLIDYIPSLTITILNILVPFLFERVVRGEDYTPQTEVQLTLIRTVFLRLASLAVLFATLYGAISCSTWDDCHIGMGNCQKFYCWESSVGQQLYKLIIIDFTAKVLSTIFVEFPRKLIVSKCSCELAEKIGYQQFVIPKNVLDLVYSQTLCWLGVFYSPLIPLLCILKLFIVFYTKKISLLSNFIPNERPYRASRSNSFFVIVLLISFIICCFPLIYAIAALTPSRGCGPYRPYSYMYESITSTVCSWNIGFQRFIGVVTSISFSIPALLILCLAIYYQSILGRAQKDRIKLLKDQLLMEGKDKQFLLSKVQELKSPPKEVAKPLMPSAIESSFPATSAPLQPVKEYSFSGYNDRVSTKEVLYEEDGRQSNPPGVVDSNV